MLQQQQQQPMGLGIFELDEDVMGGARASQGSKTGKKQNKNDEDDTNYTTVMLRNIPNKYTRQMLIDQLHRGGFRGDIDYMYLPTDFANHCNVGYCFVNMRESTARARFVTAFDGVAAQSCLPGFNSYKVCQVTRAKWQGREDNVRRLKSSPELMAQLAAHTEWLPLLLDTEGNQEPFLCEDGLSAARGPAAPRRQMRKKNQGMMPGYPGMPGMEDYAAAMAYQQGMMGMDGGDMMGMMGAGMGRGRGGGRGAGRDGKRKGRGGGAASYQDMQAAMMGNAGIPAMMSMPVMTEQGLQYIPYDAYAGAAQGYFMAYAPMGGEMYGMDAGAYGGGSYPSGWWGDGGFPDPFPGAASGPWAGARPAKGGAQQRGRRRGNSGSGQGSNMAGNAQDEGDVIDEEE